VEDFFVQNQCRHDVIYSQLTVIYSQLTVIYQGNNNTYRYHIVLNTHIGE